MLREVADLGFDAVELSHGIRISLVPGILTALDEKMLRVSSTHNFCPLPTGIATAAPNLYVPSSPDPREIEQWLRHTRRTLDFAQQVKAKVVVLHLGHVGFLLFNPARRLRAHLKRKGALFSSDAPEYKRLVETVTAKLRKQMPPFIARVKAGLEAILPYAEERGLKLGLENRERADELPLDADFPAFIDGLNKPGIAGYWHDAGHAQIKQNAGLIVHQRQLEENAGRLVGFHLHDVDAAGRDHVAIGTGSVDFAMVSKFIRPEHVVVLEFGPKVSAEEIRQSKTRIEALLTARGM